MAQVVSATRNKPAWVDLAATDAAAARAFYSKVFGWTVDVNPDPEYGGYGLARVNGKDAAGIGPTQSPDQPAAWSVYIGSDDLEILSKSVVDAGGTVAVPAFDVGDQGRMAVFQDPTGAFISAWQATQMGGFQTDGPNAFGWAELSARGLQSALPFYERVFGWTAKSVGTPQQPYTEFQLDGHSIAGAMEMNPMVPDQVPSYWMVYFAVDDVGSTHLTAIEAGATELVAPIDFPGGRMSIVNDPQGAAFGLMRFTGAPA
ncbi:MAG TPA: VOC family protein [Candidatus Limnocylindrales bacterium]|nr:VOC family protein [Candidatus Limnocylindrales bacterium]